MEKLLVALKAVADPTRLRLLAISSKSALSVSELTEIMGQSQPIISRHLKLLYDAGLLDRFREGKSVYYRLSDDGYREGNTARMILSLVPMNSFEIERDSLRLEEIILSRGARAAEYFRQHAGEWESIRSLYVEEEKVEELLLDRFPEHVENLLDIGTGTGRMLQVFADRVGRGIGVDTSYEMLSLARAALEKNEIRHCHVRYGDMYRLPQININFNIIVVHQVLRYSQDPAAVVDEASKVLEPNGKMFVVDFAPHSVEVLKEEHAHRWLGFDDREVLSWCKKAGLAIEETHELFGEPITLKFWVLSKPKPLNQDASNRIQDGFARSNQEIWK
ncbi:MAG: ArsR/SmtB family transcription factor [Alphaproteobacteria bacterium]